MKRLPLPIKPLPKILAIAIYGVVSFILWPFLLGGWLLTVLRQSMKRGATQLAIMTIVLIGSVGFGAIWVSAMFSPSTHHQETPTTNAEKPNVTATEPTAVEAAAVETVAEPPATTPYEVADVVDGDTLKVTIDGSLVTIRVIGVDTPETVDPRKPVQCFGQEASAQAKSLLAGKKVGLTSDPTQDDRDKYDRLLRYVMLEDGTDYGLKMITDGYAHEYTYNTPYQRQEAYKQAEKDANAADKGLWAPTSCDGDTTKAASTPAPAPTSTPKTTTTPKTSPTTTPSTTTNTSAVTAPPSTSTASHVDKDCKDFATHAEAQAYFDSMGGSPTNNVDGLDADHDGLVCESLK